jgi:hypothetical protein
MSDVWVKGASGDYYRLGAYRAIYPDGSASSWALWLDTNDGTAQTQLNGVFASAADAREAARKLVDGLDPGSY